MKPTTTLTTVDNRCEDSLGNKTHRFEACKNCGETLSGRFCSQCGQDAVEPIVPVRIYLARSLSEILGLDLRYPRTLRMLLHPGKLTIRYLEGQRVPYVPPLRLALSASLLLLLALAMGSPSTEEITVSSSLFEDLGVIARKHATGFALAQLLALPGFALVLKWVFTNSHKLYLSHLTFALHFHATVALGVLAGVFSGFFVSTETSALITMAVLLFILGPYLAVALRRIYGVSWLRALGLWIVLATSYTFMNGVVFGVVAAVVATIGAT